MKMKCFNTFSPIQDITTDPDDPPSPKDRTQVHATPNETHAPEKKKMMMDTAITTTSKPKTKKREPKALSSKPDQTQRYTSPAQTEAEHIAALRLIADSVAQQRQLAAKAILSDPLYWALMLYILQRLYKAIYLEPVDWIPILITWSGCQMVGMTVVKLLVRGYLDAAERTGSWVWLYGDEWLFEGDVHGKKSGKKGKKKVTGNAFAIAKAKAQAKANATATADSSSANGDGASQKTVKRADNDEGATPTTMTALETPPRRQSMATVDANATKLKLAHRDRVLVSRFGNEVIGAVVLRVRRVPVTTGSADSSDAIHGAGTKRYRLKAFIRAWTVKQRYRGHGIGVEILEFAVRYARENGWGDPVFAHDHAHSLRILPRMFNNKMDWMDARARKKLEDVAWEVELEG
ncbi:uncharacterized protein N7459_000856 [Penicillium hispanicum]|uniref:uncharacterized protein n=1 Tax=Penicillium hispanicum TaxID=1080232 RepID=UPI00253FA5ED|nr:uncharacterized protein N7459_000856 [Penicillium hispanicum]KAJ5594648.1 hypothetical protein N7459_000856 [Penicillium hispanicum]